MIQKLVTQELVHVLHTQFYAKLASKQYWLRHVHQCSTCWQNAVLWLLMYVKPPVVVLYSSRLQLKSTDYTYAIIRVKPVQVVLVTTRTKMQYCQVECSTFATYVRKTPQQFSSSLQQISTGYTYAILRGKPVQVVLFTSRTKMQYCQVERSTVDTYARTISVVVLQQSTANKYRSYIRNSTRKACTTSTVYLTYQNTVLRGRMQYYGYLCT